MKQIYFFVFLFFSTFTFAQEWEEFTSPPASLLADHTFGFAFGNTGYLVAGNTSDGYTAEFQEYDAETDSWTKKDDFPGGARGFAIGTQYEGKAYFGFGSDNFGPLNDLWVFDPETDEWTQLAECPCSPRNHPGMIAVGGEIFVGLGSGNFGNVIDWWRYNIETDSWSSMPDFPSPRRHHPFQFHDGTYMYAGFGHGDNFISVTFNDWDHNGRRRRDRRNWIRHSASGKTG